MIMCMECYKHTDECTEDGMNPCEHGGEVGQENVHEKEMPLGPHMKGQSNTADRRGKHVSIFLHRFHVLKGTVYKKKKLLCLLSNK